MRAVIVILGAGLLCGCVAPPPRDTMRAGEEATTMNDGVSGAVRVSRHDAGDDLLTAGLGLDGLRGTAPAFANPDAPTPTELRRRAIWANWRAIADLSPDGGFGTVYGSVPSVPGREFHAFARVSGANQPHRVLAQIPDAFDATKRCLVVAAVSGSRGVYGTIAFAGGWALPRGCAVVYTDKGAGTDLVDGDSGTTVTLDGTRASSGSSSASSDSGVAFSGPAAGEHRIAFKHAHSQDNPEADWGRHVVQAAAFGLRALSEAFPAQAPFTAKNTRVLVVGLSNGAGAALKAAEMPEAANFAAVVAVAPQIHTESSAPLFDYVTLAALYQPCALADTRFDDAPSPFPRAQMVAAGHLRCASLAQAGLLHGGDTAKQATEAYERLRAAGFTDAAMRAGTIDVAFDLWRAIGATYVAAYAQATPEENLCGYSFAALDAAFKPRSATPAERAAWWADSAGIAPGAGIGIVDANASGPDPALASLQCLRAAWEGSDALAQRVRAGVAATRASAKIHAPAVLVVHGADDGLVPMAFTSTPWVDAVRAKAPDAPVRFYQVTNAQHFDAFVGLPVYASAYVPLMPYAWAAIDAAWAHVATGAALPADVIVQTRPRAPGEALSTKNLGDLSVLSGTASRRP